MQLVLLPTILKGKSSSVEYIEKPEKFKKIAQLLSNQKPKLISCFKSLFGTNDWIQHSILWR